MTNIKQEYEQLLRIEDMYKKIYTLSSILSLIAIFLNINYISVAPLSLTIYSLFKEKNINKKINNSELINRLNNIYNEIINEIIKLTTTLENNNVIEHYTLINYLFSNNLLTVDKNENDTNIYVENEKYVRGAISLNGHGVCRNTSIMGVDIFNKLGYEATILTGESRENNETNYIVLLGKLLSTRPELINNPDELNKKMKMLTKKDKDTNTKKIIEKIIGNHAIIKVNDDKYSYYLDITQNAMYYPTTKKNVLYGTGENEFKIINLPIYRYGTGIIETKKTNYKCVVDSTIKTTKEKIKNNLDLLEEFNKNNRDILKEAEDIILSISTKK